MLEEHGRPPAVLPIVLYNGEAPCQSALEVSELIQQVGRSARAVSIVAALLRA